MNETFWIIGEIIVGIGILGVLSAVITAVMVPRLSRTGKQPTAAEILAQRYARGELTHEQFVQMRQDLGIDAEADGRLTAGREASGHSAVRAQELDTGLSSSIPPSRSRSTLPPC